MFKQAKIKEKVIRDKLTTRSSNPLNLQTDQKGLGNLGYIKLNYT
jgi:hypothetical protein